MEQKASPEVVETVASGRADIGFSAFRGDYPGVTFIPYREDELVLAIPADHPMARRKVVSFAECLTLLFVALTVESAMQRFVFEHAKKLGTPIVPRVQVDNQQLLMRLVQKKVGVAVLSTRAVEMNFRPAVAIVRFSDDFMQRHLRIALALDAGLRSPAAEDFLAFLSLRRDGRKGSAPRPA